MLWILRYEVVDDYVARRAPLRAGHLELATAAHERGELILAGAVGDPIDSAVLLFRAESRQTAEAFAAADPYVREGIVERWTVSPWHVVIGDDPRP